MEIENLQQIITNIKPVIRSDSMEGRRFIVAPMIMILEGVYTGTTGTLYYPAEELAKTPQAWNHKPIVVYHPDGVTACDPTILTNRKIGVIMNTKFEKGKLKAEAWLDPDRMDFVDDRIEQAIHKNQIMELSTGLFAEKKHAPGTFNGRSYEYVAINYRPDHLAILPDKRGACSVKDGAGFLRMNSADEEFFENETEPLRIPSIAGPENTRKKSDRSDVLTLPKMNFERKKNENRRGSASGQIQIPPMI